MKYGGVKIPREAKEGIKVNYNLEKQLVDELNEFCDKTGRTKTKVVEMAIRDFLDKHKDKE